MFKHILLPIDFSVCAERALPRALALAECFGAEIHLLHVLHPGVNETVAQQQGEANVFNFWHEERIRTRLNALRLTYRLSLGRRSEVPVHTAVFRTQDPAEGITTYARQHQADLIVMGTHGRSACFGNGMGAVAKDVIGRATCPVMTVPVQRQVAGIVRRVFLPVGMGRPRPLLLRYADAIARLLDCSLVLLDSDIPSEVLSAETTQQSKPGEDDLFIVSNPSNARALAYSPVCSLLVLENTDI